MPDYLRAEVFRLFRKKSLYGYFGAVAALYLLLVFVRSGGLSATQLPTDAQFVFSLLPAVAGGAFFAALYTDDLHARNLPTLIGFGLGRARIVVSKLVLIAGCGALVFGLVPLFMAGAFTVVGTPLPLASLAAVYAYSLSALLQTVAFAALAAIAVFGLQRASFSLVTYLLLALGVVGQLLSALFNTEAVSSLLPGVTDHLLSGISQRVVVGVVTGGPVTLPLIEFAIYLVASVTLSILAFRGKELEF